MSNAHPSIHEYLVPGKRAHLVGIGGVSMCPLAEVLSRMGLRVQGSDMSESASVRRLRGLGIPVAVGHNAENLGQCDFVVRTAAVGDSNPEIAGAAARGIPVFERAEGWGEIMRRYPNALCISGTHGKTTTTSMCTHIFMAAGRDPTVMIGGTLPMLHAGYRVGEGDTIILESCEYRNSFLYFAPTVAVLLNVEADHLDFFRDLEDIQHSFRRFAELVPASGCVIVNADNASARKTVEGLDRRVVTFGLNADTGDTAGPEGTGEAANAAGPEGTGAAANAEAAVIPDCTAANLRQEDGFPVFDVLIHGEPYAHVRLRLHGRHNISNALAAAASAWVLGLPGKAVEEGLAGFTGAGRRFERKGTYHGADIYDDYAHHPDELHALLVTAKSLGYRRIVAAFQPHTYSRTAKLFDRFVEELRIPDVAVLAEIYAAREQNTLGISSADLCKQIPGAVYCSTLEETARKLRELIQPGDLVLTVGAGDIYRVGEALVREEQEASGGVS